ncbi:MAG: right-handed parallel beta-helix repeat-containing protein [Thermoplasmata archaeon]|nr:right-handed parallel beta-helix repeat-containing protein [Thermoplasmata archaeon]
MKDFAQLMIVFLLTCLILLPGVSIATSGQISNDYNFDIVYVLENLSEEKLRKRVIEIEIDLSSSRLVKFGDRFYVDIKGCFPSGRFGYPIVPQKTIVVDFPINVKIVKISVSKIKFREIKGKITLVNSPPTLTWNHSLKKFLSKITRIRGFYPGKILRYSIASDGSKKLLIMKLYPLQYLQTAGKATILTRCTIEIYYLLTGEGITKKGIGCKNIIITHPSLYREACLLKKYHDMEGISTSIFNTTWIYRNYNEKEDPPYEGFKDIYLYGWDKINSYYNYSLAKRIIAFLNDRGSHPDLEYVTILGDARLVPPSYYFHSQYSWIPTDFFYASPDYDMVPNYKVGRLPARNVEEAHHIVEKITKWNGSSELLRKVAVVGGAPFRTPLYIGELITVDAINRNYFNGIRPLKLFKTNGLISKENLTRIFKGNFGILYHIGHGNGKSIILERSALNASDLLKLPACRNLPIVISISCTNGAFDPFLLGSNLSFGEAVLLSNASGIAYIGGSRANFGIPTTYLEKGHLKILRENYMAEMLSNILKWYSKGVKRLGDIVSEAMKDYFLHNDFCDPINNHTFFGFVLLGDPALRIPDRPKGDARNVPKGEIEVSEGYTDADYFFTLTKGGTIPVEVAKEEVRLCLNANFSIKIVDCFNDSLESSFAGKTFNLSFERPSLYLIRSEADDGKEDWLYLASAYIVDASYDHNTKGWHVSRWESIKKAIENLSKGIVFVHGGRYEDSLNIDSDEIYLIGKEKVFIGKMENEANLLIKGTSCVLANLHVIGGSKVAIGMESSTTRIFNCSVTGEKGYGIYSKFSYIYVENSTVRGFDEGIFLVNSLCTCLNNRIEGAKKGIHLIKGFSEMTLNTFTNNTYGIYVEGEFSCILYYNNFSFNEKGVYLVRSNYNIIAMNNFIGNKRHASFENCRTNLWMSNYWDNWIGIKHKIYVPKVIIGRIAIVPWVNFDLSPAKEPYSLENYKTML